MRSLTALSLLLGAIGLVATEAPTVSATGTVTSAIGTGETSTCALTSGGGVKCWGHNSAGQLGNATTSDSFTPVDVSGLSTGVTAITVGGAHACALLSGGGVKCWGWNLEGQLGNGTTTNSPTPVDVTGLSSGVTAVAAGLASTCAVTSGGGVKCWGSNDSGALGNGTTTSSSTPVDVIGLSGGATAVAVGLSHACAIAAEGGVKCWGNNLVGELGNGTNTTSSVPVDVSGLSSGVAGVAAGGVESCAITSTGGAKCWGYNVRGQLGNGTNTDSNTPVDVSGLGGGVARVAVGLSHACGATSAGGATCWGYDNYGQLGNGTITDSTTPVDVSGLSTGVAGVATGAYHACALTSTGQVKCWGHNQYGQLGNGTAADSPVPVDVVFDSTPPAATITLSGPDGGVPDGSGGWFVHGPVTGSVGADDSTTGGSAISSIDCTGAAFAPATGLGTPAATRSLTVSAQGASTVSCTATDSSANTSSAVVTTVMLDSIGPTVAVTGVTGAATYPLGAVPVAGCSTTDPGGSGVQTPASPSVAGGTANGVGAFTATCAGATDVAGNPQAAPVSESYSVVYVFRGFYSPVNDLPTVNTGKSGRTYPFKWNLTTSTGSNVSALSAVTNVTYGAVSCGSFANDPTDWLEASATGGSLLRYDGTQFVYNWQTPGKGCYVLRVYLDDGSSIRADFNLS